MKIGGPKGPGPITPPPAPAAEKPTATQGPKFSEVLGADSPAPGSAAGPNAIADITQRLKAGEIDASQATELIIEEVVRAKVGALTPALQDRLRQTLKQMVADDPLLAERVKNLSRSGG